LAHGTKFRYYFLNSNEKKRVCIMTDNNHYQPLPKAAVSTEGCYLLEAFNPPAVNADSPALRVMTDLSQVPSATITADASLEDANQSMLVRGVRSLFVVGSSNDMTGLVTSVDVLGEKPVLVAQKRQSRRSDLRVADVMVPVEQVETLSIEDVKRASVGNIVATLKLDGRAHAIVVGKGEGGHQTVLGIFSASQIARQLGVQIQSQEIARTFAEIEAVIAHV
jgi:signal-transduction protein with cAMP-binding, CBS, and nucleotidyltransferase domain